MKTNLLQHLAINDDVDAEFSYWKSQLLFAAAIATGFAIAAGIAIGLWPQGSGNAEMRDFVRNLWTLFVECAFWLGFLLGLLRGAAKRIVASLSGTLPWQSARPRPQRAVSARFFGH